VADDSLSLPHAIIPLSPVLLMALLITLMSALLLELFRELFRPLVTFILYYSH